MTQKQKQILLKDLCARLPYGFIVHTKLGTDIKIIGIEEDTLRDDTGDTYDISFIEPYLRPMSSMTEKEINEYENFITNEKDDLIRFCNELVFYNSHHFDYRGLISMGLALEAPKGMYKTE